MKAVQLKLKYGSAEASERDNQRGEKGVQVNSMNRRAVLKAGVASACVAVLPLQKAMAAERDWSGRSPVAYPDPAIEVIDDRFRRFGPPPQASVERLATGFRFTEGPC